MHEPETSALVIRSLAPLVQKHPLATWYSGSIQPYASLWLTVHRFLLLNRPTKRAFMDAFIQSGRTLEPTCVGLSGVVLAPSGARLNLQKFSSALDEPLSAFRWSRVDDFSPGLRPLFKNAFLYCPSCMEQGFHTVLYLMEQIDKCPRHNEPLQAICTQCDADLSGVINSHQFSSPACCQCGNKILKLSAARTPVKDNLRTRRLRDLVDWLDEIGRRCWVDMTPTVLTGGLVASPYRILRAHARRWHHDLGIPQPPEWWMPLEPSHFPLSGNGVCRHQFGGLNFGNHSVGLDATISHPPLRRDSPLRQGGPGDQLDASQLFKSIKRYLLKHVLLNQNKWIVRLAMSSDSQWILNQLKSNDDARRAWTFLLWWQSSVQSLSLRDWFARRRFSNWDAIAAPLATWKPIQTSSYSTNTKTDVQRWVSAWLNAASLMSLWRMCSTQTEKAINGGGAVWGHGVGGIRIHPRYSATVGQSDRLELYIESPNCRIWPRAQQVDPEARRNTRRIANLIAEKRRAQFMAASKTACIRFEPNNRTWTFFQALAVESKLENFQVHRLLTGAKQSPKQNHLFAIFSQGVGATKRWFVRSLLVPIIVIDADSSLAIAGLKVATVAYLKQFPNWD